MQNFVSFWSDFLGVVCDFLLSEPIVYFTGLFILIVIGAFLKQLITVSR